MMLSRTGASLYWLGRYLERADFIARLIEATVRLDVDVVAAGGGDRLVVGACGHRNRRGVRRQRRRRCGRPRSCVS